MTCVLLGPVNDDGLTADRGPAVKMIITDVDLEL